MPVRLSKLYPLNIFPCSDPGSKLDPAKHKVVQAVHGPESGIIIEQTRPGIIFNGEEVIRYNPPQSFI